MSKLITRIRHLIKSEDGPTAVEYAIMVALIAVAIIATVGALGDQINTTFGEITSAMQ